MKILLSYPSEHDKTEGHQCHRVLTRMGHEVVALNVAARTVAPGGRVVAGYPIEVSIQDLVKQHGGADLFLYIEPQGLIPRGLESSPIPTACILSDVHRALAPRIYLAGFFDSVFLYQRNYQKHFSDHPAENVHWWPWTCDTDAFRDQGLERDLDIAWVGRMDAAPDRRRIIGTLANKYPMNEIRYHLHSEVPSVYGRAKIVLNLPIGDDLNPRHFEAMACGALLLARRQHGNGVEELFEEGVHYDVFVDEAELFAKIDHYLKHEDERLRIARRGCEEVMAKHGMALRFEWLLEAATKQCLWGAPIRKLSPNEVLRRYVQLYEKRGAIDALLRVAAEHRNEPALYARLFAMAMKSFARRTVFTWREAYTQQYNARP